MSRKVAEESGNQGLKSDFYFAINLCDLGRSQIPHLQSGEGSDLRGTQHWEDACGSLMRRAWNSDSSICQPFLQLSLQPLLTVGRWTAHRACTLLFIGWPLRPFV